MREEGRMEVWVDWTDCQEEDPQTVDNARATLPLPLQLHLMIEKMDGWMDRWADDRERAAPRRHEMGLSHNWPPEPDAAGAAGRV